MHICTPDPVFCFFTKPINCEPVVGTSTLVVHEFRKCAPAGFVLNVMDIKGNVAQGQSLELQRKPPV